MHRRREDRAQARLSPHRHRRALRQRGMGGRGAASGPRRAAASSARTCSSPPRSIGTSSRPATSRNRSRRACKKLKLPWVDLLLIHWNNPKVPLADSIKSLCNAKKKGQAKHVGVANFTTAMLDEATKLATEPLVTNQIEVHPFLDQTQGAGRLQEARHVGDRLLPDRARQGARQRDARAHRQGARQELVAGRAALSGAAGHHPDPAHRQARRISRPILRCSISR